ncbi:MAG: MBL fold metallo-hydrolase [archaeon]
MVEICTVGGFSEVGKNMTVIRYKGEAVILDMGVQVDKYIAAKDDAEDEIVNFSDLLRKGAVPDERLIKEWRKEVLAIVPTHAHLDHLGAIPYMANKYDADIICSRYSAAVLRALLEEKNSNLKKRIIELPNNATYKVSENITIEFIEITHSTPDTVMIAVHTPDETIVYCNDFKLDDTPTLGNKPNYKRIKALGKEGIKLLIMDSLYSRAKRKTPSESVARERLKEVLFETDLRGKGLIVTTFSSHIARLKAIAEFGEKLGRRVLFMGRSLAKYSYAAQDCGIYQVSDHAEIVGYKAKVKKRLKEIERENRDKYMLVVTGHQGELDSVLSSIVDEKINYKLFPGDIIIFSCCVIPNPVNIANRKVLEEKLLQKRITIYKDIHESGHASGLDHRELISMLKPEYIIPAHGDSSKTEPLLEIAEELGYVSGKTVLIMHDGAIIKL